MRSLVAAKEDLRQVQTELVESHSVALQLSNARIAERQELVRVAKERQRAVKEYIEQQQKKALTMPLKEIVQGMLQRLAAADLVATAQDRVPRGEEVMRQATDGSQAPLKL